MIQLLSSSDKKLQKRNHAQGWQMVQALCEVGSGMDAETYRQSLLDFAISQSSSIFYVASLAGDSPVRYISANVEAITGHKPEDFLKEANFGLHHIHPKDRKRYLQAMKVLKSEGALTHEYRFAGANGSYAWFRDELRLIGSGENSDEFVGCMSDITAEKEAETRLAHSDAERRRLARLLADAVQSLPTGFTLYDSAGKLILANRAIAVSMGGNADAEEFVGLSRADMVKRFLPIVRSFDGDLVSSTPEWSRRIEKRLRGLNNDSFEAQLNDGSWRLVSGHPTSEGGQVVISTDITHLKEAETRVRKSEEQFRTIFEANPLPVRVTVFGTWELLYESPAATALFEEVWPPREGRTTSESYADEEVRLKVIHELATHRRVDAMEVQMRRRHGSTFWTALSSRVVPFGDKDVCVTSFVDLTEAKKREQAIRQSHEILEDAIEALSDGFVLYDSNNRLITCNSRYKDYNQDSAELLVPGAYWPDVTRARGERGLFTLAKDNLEDWLADQLAQRGKAQHEEFPASDDRWFEYSHRPTRQGGFVSTWRDITRRKNMESALMESEALVRQVLEASPLPLRMWNPATGQVIYESPACHKMFGRDSTKDAEGERLDVYVNRDDRRRYLEILLRDKAIENFDMRLRRVDGSMFWSNVSARVIEYKGEEVVVSTIIDLTESKEMELALRESEQRFRIIVEGHPLPVWMVDLETSEIIYESPAAAALFGRAWPSSKKGFTIDYFADPSEREKLNNRLRREGKLRDVECKFRKCDGSEFWASLSDRFITYNGREASITGLVDLTERKQREAEVQRARETLEDAIESLPEGFALFDHEDKLVLCNERFREFNKLSADALEPGITWAEFIEKGLANGQYLGDYSSLDSWLEERKCCHSEAPNPHSIEFQQSDGRWFYAFGQETRQGGIVLIRIDITELKQMELALRDSEGMVRQVLEACPVPITMNRVDDGTIIYESPAARELLGFVESQEGKSVVDRWIDPKDRDRYLKRLRKTGSVDDLEIRYRKADGTEFPCAMSSRLIEFRGEPVIVSNLFDLTERRSAEDEFERQREMLHQSEKLSALGELLAGVSHELNNPLSVLVGQAQMLKEMAEDDLTVTRAEKIGKAADRCARIVKTFLAMARNEPNAIVPLNLNTILEEALDVTAYALRTSNIDLSLRLAKNLPLIDGDPDQLRQVVTNLIVNAQHALQVETGERKLRISTHYRKGSERAVLKIKDNGPGIPKEISSRIFEPLYTTKEIGTGTGMGLALCHRIVEAHGGTIVLESKPHEGAAFAIRLPCSSAKSNEDDHAGDSEVIAGKYKILVVDDEYDVGEIISDVLQFDGHQVEVAGSGKAALEKVKHQSYDAILSDIRMPGMDGPAFYRALTKVNSQLINGLAFITGDTLSPHVKEFLEASERPYLEKPLMPNEIRDLVELLIRRQRE